MSGSNPSTVWGQLALPFSPVGSMPFVYTDGVTIQTAVGYLWWNQAANQLSVNCPFDQTGTDSINTYYNQDSYWAYNAAVNPLGANGTTAGHTVSSSRGTGPVPVISQANDFIGMFSAWSYTGSTPTYQEIGAINFYAVGTTGSANGIGGELRLATKGDNGVLNEWVKLTNTGNFRSVTDNTSSLGGPGIGWAGLYLSSTIAGTTGAQTINKSAGKVLIAAAGTTLVITNSLVTAASIVQAQLETVDATAKYVVATPGAGIITLTLNAAATGQVTVNFLVILS